MVSESGALGDIGNRTISVARVDNSMRDETVAHSGKREAVIRVAVVADGSSMERVSRDRCDGTITRMPANKEVRERDDRRRTTH